MQITHKSSKQEVLIGPKSKEGLYNAEIKVKLQQDQIFQVASRFENTFELWHRHLGHMSQTTMDKSVKIVFGIQLPPSKKFSKKLCAPCANG